MTTERQRRYAELKARLGGVMHGCCVDLACSRTVPGKPTCMEHVPGKTCADCVHTRRCTSIFGMKATDTYCHIFPSRFTPREAHDRSASLLNG